MTLHLVSMLLILCKYQIIIGIIEFHVYAYISMEKKKVKLIYIY